MLCDLSPLSPVPGAGGFTHLSLSRNAVITLGRTGLLHDELTHRPGGTFHEKHVCPPEIITLLVQEGTRNYLQTAPKQTPHPRFPPAPAWLFSLSHTSLLLSLGQGMKAGKGGSWIFPRQGSSSSPPAQHSPVVPRAGWGMLQGVTMGTKSHLSSL